MRDVLRQKTESLTARTYLGGIYMQKKKNAEAIVELEKYLQLKPKAADAKKIKTTIEGLKKKSS